MSQVQARCQRTGRSMTTGELEDAKRRALQLFDNWLQVTGLVDPASTYYYELQGIVEDAVHCGAQAATGDFKRLDSEEDFPSIPGWKDAGK